MAATQIVDVVVPAQFSAYVQVLSTELSAFVRSGVVVQEEQFDQMLSGGGRIFDMPFYNDLANTEANVSSDALAGVDDAVPEKITTGQDKAIRHNRNQVWSSADLTGQLSGDDPQDAIVLRVADYWVRQQQSYLINMLAGVFADNVANDSGDMVVDIALGGAGTPTAVNLFSAEAFIDAQQTMGDAMDQLVAVAMHSVVFSRAKKNNLIDFIPDSEGSVDIPFFQGLRVILDDGMPTALVSGNIEYTTYFFGAGAIASGVGSPKVATEVDRFILAGKGGGQEVLVNRIEWILHPRGVAFQDASVAGQSPTNAELATATNWNRVFERKLIRLAALITHG